MKDVEGCRTDQSQLGPKCPESLLLLSSLGGCKVSALLSCKIGTIPLSEKIFYPRFTKYGFALLYRL